MKSLLIIFALVLVEYNVEVLSHGAMVKPYNWFDKKTQIWTGIEYVYDYYGMKSTKMCSPGSEITSEDICPGHEEDCNVFPLPGQVCFWYKNGTKITKPTLFDQNLRTYPHVGRPMNYLYNPWRAPGSAPVDSPCGVAGGNLDGCEGGCSAHAGGYAYGLKAEQFKFKHSFFVTNWTRGQSVEVAWGIIANHGGGYSYRLCKVPESGISGITEECFHKTPLRFVGDTQWVQYGEDESTRKSFPAVRVDQGTFPEGSQWTKNPIPACNGGSGGAYDITADCPTGTQYPPPLEGLFGFGISLTRTHSLFKFSIIDKVHIPKELEPGNYVLSFRWDTEQTPQVWNTCASIYLD